MKHKLLSFILLLSALVAGTGSVWADDYSKITSIDGVSDGGEYIFTSGAIAMSTTQDANNRGQISVTITGNTISNPASGVEIITLESTGTANQYYLKNERQ